MSEGKFEFAFTVDASNVKYGPGATSEVGYEVKRLGAKRVMLVSDPKLVHGDAVSVALKSLRSEGIDVMIYDDVRIEPTDESFKDAIQFAVKGSFDGYVAIGGGSTIDTAKVANLYATYPASFLTYVNPPLGQGQPVPGELKPLVAIPTTAGTGSETTAVAVFGFVGMHVKTDISHRALRPAMGIIDPNNTKTLPRMVAACTGFDVLSHALESFTTLPYNQKPAPASPNERSTYQGSNPISDIWAARAIEMVSRNIVRAVENPDDNVRGQMLLASTFAGIGFGNAGVHLPHAMSYAVSGMVRNFLPEGYPRDHPIIPHGMSVILNTPAVLRFTAATSPQRHLYAAKLMGVDTSAATPEDAGEMVASAVVDLMRKTGMPNGLSEVGYSPDDIPKLVAGTLPQQRITKLSPRPISEADLGKLFLDSMTCW